MSKLLVRITPNISKYAIIGDTSRYAFIWDKEGGRKVLETPDDFIFSRGEMKEVLDKLRELNELNPELMERVQIYKSKMFIENL